MDTIKFAYRLRKYRTDRNLSIAQLAANADISESYIRRLEAAKSVPAYEMVIKLAKALKVTPNCLIYDEDVKEPDLLRKISPYKIDALNEKQVTLLKNIMETAISLMENETSHDVATRIVNARESKGLTGAEMIKRLKSPGGYIRNIEAGHEKPSISILEKIADLLEIDLNYLVCDDFKEAEIYVLNDMMKNAQTQLSPEDYNFLKLLFNSIISDFGEN